VTGAFLLENIDLKTKSRAIHINCHNTAQFFLPVANFVIKNFVENYWNVLWTLTFFVAGCDLYCRIAVYSAQYLEQARHEEALSAWMNATFMKPTHVSAWTNLIILLGNLGRL